MMMRTRKPPHENTSRILLAVLTVMLTCASQVTAKQGDPVPKQSAQPTPAQPPVESPPLTRDPNSYTEAERIAGLTQLIKEDEQRVQQLRSELAALEFEFERASKEFSRLDAGVTEKRKQVDKPAEGLPPDAVAALQAELADLTSQRKTAQDAFDLIIKRRKTSQAQITTLEEKITLSRAGLDRMMGVVPPPTGEQATPPTDRETRPSSSEPTHQLREVPPPPPVKIAIAPSEPAAEVAAATPVEGTEALRSADIRVAAARKEFELKQAALAEAETQLSRLDHGIVIFEQDIANEQQSLENSNQQIPMIEETLGRLQVELEQQAAAGATDQKLDASRTHIDQQKAELAKVTDSLEASAQRISSLTQQLSSIRASREDAITQLDLAQTELRTASRWLRWMESPFAPHKVLDWFQDRGPKILVVLLILVGSWWLMRILARRMIRGLARRSRTGTVEEREERAQTLIGVLQSVMTITIVGIGMLAVLDQAGVDVTVLMGGAAAMGVAIGFGAQNLMRDYFYGSMILAENQYRVGNVVKIAGISGMVEHITLRITVLRDLEGVVHFIPHSQITTVSNLTQGWSRAMFEIGVAYKEDVDQVMGVLMELGYELRQDERYCHLIIDDPEMLGVDNFGDSAVVIKFLLKTRPLKQWQVKRELLRRIKNRFDELGIEIPYPHRTVYHRGLVNPSAIEGTSN